MSEGVKAIFDLILRLMTFSKSNFVLGEEKLTVCSFQCLCSGLGETFTSKFT